MIRIIITFLALTISCPLFAQGKVNRKPSSSGRTNKATAIKSNISGTINGHDYVDLGLPSGIKWATCNVGANESYNSGNYYAWGETSPKSEYSWDNYFDYDYTNEYGTVFCKKYKGGNNTEDKNLILPNGGNDVARKTWGATWRMPTFSEMRELIDKCKWQCISVAGISCWKIIGPSKKFIIMPLSGKMKGDKIEGRNEWGYYWTATVGKYQGPGDAEGIAGYWRGYSGGIGERYQGAPIRPVSD